MEVSSWIQNVLTAASEEERSIGEPWYWEAGWTKKPQRGGMSGRQLYNLMSVAGTDVSRDGQERLRPLSICED